MKKVILDLNNIQLLDRSHPVFYASNDRILYKERSTLVLADCEDNVLSTSSIPTDFRLFECTENEEDIVLLFSGKSIRIVNKNGTPQYGHDLNPLRTGRSVIKPVLLDKTIMLGTSLLDRLQFVNYDFIKEQRLFQTSSWQMYVINDLKNDENNCYGLLDYSTMICFDKTTCETKWQRFETGRINSIFPYNDVLLYTCDNAIKSSHPDLVPSFKIPNIKAQKIEHIHKDCIYLVSGDGKDISCFDMKKQKTKWNLIGNREIKETLFAEGNRDGEIINIIVVRMEDNIAVINADAGKVIHYRQIPKVFRIYKTADHIILSLYNGASVLMPSIGE